MLAKAKKCLLSFAIFEGMRLDSEVNSLQAYKTKNWDDFDAAIKSIKTEDPQERHDEESALYSEYSAYSNQYDDEIA
jgi:hypothetical protein